MPVGPCLSGRLLFLLVNFLKFGVHHLVVRLQVDVRGHAGKHFRQVDPDDIGMGGAGGSSGWWSFTGEYAAAYVTRGLGTHDRDEAVWALVESVYSRP